MTMQRRHVPGARNRLDLTNRVQVRIIRKRLKVTDEQLASLVRTAGNSISAVNREARRRLTLPGIWRQHRLAGTGNEVLGYHHKQEHGTRKSEREQDGHAQLLAPRFVRFHEGYTKVPNSGWTCGVWEVWLSLAARRPGWLLSCPATDARRVIIGLQQMWVWNKSIPVSVLRFPWSISKVRTESERERTGWRQSSLVWSQRKMVHRRGCRYCYCVAVNQTASRRRPRVDLESLSGIGPWSWKLPRNVTAAKPLNASITQRKLQTGPIEKHGKASLRTGRSSHWGPRRTLVRTPSSNEIPEIWT